jgi:1-acyl-sn-glycerol-3-phosphate acyltransferase
MDALLNYWAWASAITLVIVSTPVMVVIFCLTAPFDAGRYAAGRFFRLVGVAAVKINPLWKFETIGPYIADPRRPYVVVSNHESYADIFLISHLPWEMKWMSKQTMFHIPCFGWMMRMAGDIRLVREDKRSAVNALAAARDRLGKKVSVMIFPEGTRSRDGELLPFKNGAFKLAIETGSPILPLVVAGSRSCMQKGTFKFQRARAWVKVLPPISTEGMTTDDVAALRERTRTVIAETRVALVREMGARLAH